MSYRYIRHPPFLGTKEQHDKFAKETEGMNIVDFFNKFRHGLEKHDIQQEVH